VDVWLPIHRWSTEEVWGRIAQAGTRVHPAYTVHGMPRLSCQLCPLASNSALVRAARANPGKAAEYQRVEQETGHQFKHEVSMGQIIEQASTAAASALAPDTWAG